MKCMYKLGVHLILLLFLHFPAAFSLTAERFHEELMENLATNTAEWGGNILNILQ